MKQSKMGHPWSDSGSVRIPVIISATSLLVSLLILGVFFIPLGRIDYTNALPVRELAATTTEPVKPLVTHVPTPDSVRAVYLTSWAAGTQKFREHIKDLIENTEINAVVIDVKDYSGRVSFHVSDPKIEDLGAVENRIPDIKEYINTLHEKGVYVIGRVSSFQDSYLINVRPEWAVKTRSGAIWKDYKGVKWLDAGEQEVWKYLAAIGNAAYEVGFDEINFDYIRFPSDGNMQDIYFPKSHGLERTVVMKGFYEFLHNEFAPKEIPISADLFGLTTSSSGDLGIGQNLSDALKYFDFVSPMVYPSHYSNGYAGKTKPVEYPYEVVHRAMLDASVKAYNASTTPNKIRPWLQDFSLGTKYNKDMVRAQIQATYDAGLNSWMLWNAGSIYSKGALLPK